MSNINRPTIKTRNTAVCTGIDEHITASVFVGGVSYTPAALKAVFTAHNAALDQSDALHKQWTDQVQVAKAAGAKADATYLLLRSSLVGQYGNDANAVLNDFGMVAPKAKGAKTVKVKAQAADKSAATRVARHTMGPVQRKAVTGASVATTAPAPATSPQAVAPAASTAPTAAPAPATPVTTTTH